MPALPSSVINPLFSQFKALLPTPTDAHSLGCHRPRVPDHVVFDKLIARLVLGGPYTKHADETVSATTLRARRDEWIAVGVFSALEQIVLETFDRRDEAQSAMQPALLLEYNMFTAEVGYFEV